MKYEDAIEAGRLDPEDPKVYLDPLKVQLLDPVNKMIAEINIALQGKGDEVAQVEAFLKEMGYEITFDGVLDAGELKAVEHCKRQLQDADFKETALEIISMTASAVADRMKTFKPLEPEDELNGPRRGIVSDPF